jgi:hypothetical protein
VGEILLLVGPEGGISPAERAALRESGAIEARLGPTVLRTSTAGAAAAALLLSRIGRWLGSRRPPVRNLYCDGPRSGWHMRPFAGWDRGVSGR